MNLKIIYRSASVWNIILHFFLSYFFVILQNAIISERSVLSFDFYKQVNYFFQISASLMLGAFLVFQVKKISKAYYALTFCIVTIYSINKLFIDFNKLILIVLFIYILVSYYLFQILKNDLDQAYYNPRYRFDDLFPPMLYEIKVNLEGNKDGERLSGILTNWNEDGCFIKLESPLLKTQNFSLNFDFKGQIFSENAMIVALSKCKTGVGMKFTGNSNQKKGWLSFFNILSEMGMHVEYLK